jgi:hypothetical protein
MAASVLRCVLAHPDDNMGADGEVVWSWRRDRGVKFLGSSGFPGATVAKNAAHRGEHV